MYGNEKPGQGIVQTEAQWGPENPGYNNDVDQFGTFDYMAGYAQKIKMDLLRVAQMYNGRRIKIYRRKSAERCPKCTNQITGEIMMSDCPVCHGTGRVGGWDVLCEAYAYGDIGSKYHVATTEGVSEGGPGNRGQYIVVGTDEKLKDRDFFVFMGSRDVYLVYDVEPFQISMQGTLVAQVVSASAATPKSPEYSVVDW